MVFSPTGHEWVKKCSFFYTCILSKHIHHNHKMNGPKIHTFKVAHRSIRMHWRKGIQIERSVPGCQSILEWVWPKVISWSKREREREREPTSATPTSFPITSSPLTYGLTWCSGTRHTSQSLWWSWLCASRPPSKRQLGGRLQSTFTLWSRPRLGGTGQSWSPSRLDLVGSSTFLDLRPLQQVSLSLIKT